MSRPPAAFSKRRQTGRQIRAALPAIVLLVSFGLGLGTVVTRLASSVAASSPASWHLSAIPDLTSLRADTEHAMAPVVERLAESARAADWLVLGDLGPRVLQGQGGWLFLNDELTVLPRAEDNGDARAQTLAKAARALSARHITLLVAIIPDKSRIEASHLGNIKRPAALASRTRDWAAQLERLKVPVIDLSDTLEHAPGPTFLKTDTHWNETGSRTAAEAIAARLRHMSAALGTPTEFRIAAQTQALEWGDLIRVAGIDHLPHALLPNPDSVVRSQVETPSPGGDSDSDLFGDAGVPRTVLIGTSYSNHANFQAMLELACHARVANVAVSGGDFLKSAQRYFASDAFHSQPPETIVWEVPERIINTPIGFDERTWMQSAFL